MHCYIAVGGGVSGLEFDRELEVRMYVPIVFHVLYVDTCTGRYMHIICGCYWFNYMYLL